MKTHNRYFMLAALLLAFVSIAEARWVNVLPPVTADDVALMKEAARDRMDGQPEGTVNTWENPQSKNSGKVTLLKRTEEDGRECRLLRHEVFVVHYSPWERVTKICRDEAGQWEVRKLPEGEVPAAAE